MGTDWRQAGQITIPHSETDLVLEGELHVEAGGVTLIASAGDTVTVPGGQFGRSLGGDDTDLLGYWEI